MKELKRKLLFVLASDVDFFETVEAFSYWPYEMVYWRMAPFAKVSVRGAMNQLVETGMVARIIRNGSPRFRLAAVGRDQLVGMLGVGRGERRWDKTWRVVILDRGILKPAELRRLKLMAGELGFVSLESGVLVSPFDNSMELKKQLVEGNLLRAVTVMETKRFVVGDDRAFASDIWGVDKLVKRQQSLISQADKLLNRVKRAKVLTDSQKVDYLKLLNLWFEILWDDPGLPKKLLPADWPHLEAREMMVKLAKMVRRTEEEEHLFASVL